MFFFVSTKRKSYTKIDVPYFFRVKVTCITSVDGIIFWLLISVTDNNNSPIQDYVHPDDQTQPTFEMTPGFKPFTDKYSYLLT